MDSWMDKEWKWIMDKWILGEWKGRTDAASGLAQTRTRLPLPSLGRSGIIHRGRHT